MTATKEKIPIFPMNNYALKALFEENRRLREQLDEEKSNLSNDIDELKKHIQLSDKLARANRISSDLVERFMSISSSLDSLQFNPNLTFHKTPSSKSVDLSDKLKKLQNDCEILESQYREAGQKRANLALEEQKLSTRRSNLLQSISVGRQEYTDLLSQKEKLEHAINDLQDLKNFWEKRNSEVSIALKSAETEISSIANSQDAESIEQLKDLYTIYDTLDVADHILQEKV